MTETKKTKLECPVCGARFWTNQNPTGDCCLYEAVPVEEAAEIIAQRTRQNAADEEKAQELDDLDEQWDCDGGYGDPRWL